MTDRVTDTLESLNTEERRDAFNGLAQEFLSPAAINPIIEPMVGQRMEDGTVFAGLSPDTNKAFYVRPVDEPLRMKWFEAMNYAIGFEGHGKPKGAFRLGTPGELRIMFENRAAIGEYNEIEGFTNCRYWSSEGGNLESSINMNFSEGYLAGAFWSNRFSVRLVCD